MRSRATPVEPGSAGFTLVEFMTVIAIVVVLTAVAAPSYRSFTEAQRSRGAGLDLFNTLFLARSEAIKRNRSVTITPASGGWAGGWTVTAADGTVISRRGALNGVVVTSGAANVTYTRSGRLSAAAAPFQIDIGATASDHVRCLSIDLSGMPRLNTGVCP